jgi:hypothetical protein
MFSAVVVTVHMQVVHIEEQWTWLHHLAIWLSQGELSSLWVVWMYANCTESMAIIQHTPIERHSSQAYVGNSMCTLMHDLHPSF